MRTCKCGKEIKNKAFRCTECNAQYFIEYRKKNPDKIKNNNKVWRETHKEHISEYRKARYQKNPNVKIMSTFYSSLRRVILNERSGKKFVKTLGLENRNQLMGHLISTIPEGYTINDYGNKLHVDHIKPACSFDLCDACQRDECFHYTNLRLIPKEENQIKVGRDRKISIQ